MLAVYLQETLSKIMKSPFYEPKGVVASSLSRPYQKQHGDTLRQISTGTDQRTVLHLNFQEPSMAEVLRQSFLNLHPEISNISAMH